MAENNQFDSRNNEQEQEQKDQFRSFVEQVAGENNSKNESLRDQSRTADEQNRMIDEPRPIEAEVLGIVRAMGCCFPSSVCVV